MSLDSKYHLFTAGVIEILHEIASLSYPYWMADVAPYLPDIDLTCVATSGINYFNNSIPSSTSATVSGFLDAIMVGCSDAFLLSGGYNNSKQELDINMIVETSANTSL